MPPASNPVMQEQTKAAEKQGMGVWGKVLLGALVGLPVGMVAGLKYVYSIILYM